MTSTFSYIVLLLSTLIRNVVSDCGSGQTPVSYYASNRVPTICIPSDLGLCLALNLQGNTYFYAACGAGSWCSPHSSYDSNGAPNVQCIDCPDGYWATHFAAGTDLSPNCDTYGCDTASNCQQVDTGCIGPSGRGSPNSCPTKCANGKQPSSSRTKCDNCPQGHWGTGGTCPGVISAGCYLPTGSLATSACPASCSSGRYSRQGDGYCSNISPGCYAGSTGSKVSCPNTCSPGTYSNAGASACQNINAGCYSTNSGDSVSCPNTCGPGTWSPGGATSCQRVSPGCTASGYGATSSCPYRCPPGTYTDDGISCKWCGLSTGFISYTPANLAPYHFQTISGTGLKSQCECAPGWQGTLCEFENCPNDLVGVSLLSLFFNSDATLRSFSSKFNHSLVNDQLQDVGLYFYNLLSSTIDIDGNGRITKPEAIQALGYRSVYSPAFSQSPIGMKLWCSNVHLHSSSGCHMESSGLRDNAYVLVSDVYYEGLNNFLNASKHTFDGSGIDLITTIRDPIAGLVSSMVSTQPSASWEDADCQSADRTWNPNAYSPITTTYDFYSITDISRVCAYINGRWLSFPRDVSLTNKLSGKTRAIDDSTYPYSVIGQGPSIYHGPKRIFCIYLNYKRSLAGGYECSVGWSQDGTPMDLTPELTENGIVFAYIDGSVGETEFDIYVGSLTSDFQSSSFDTKTFIVGIPYPSRGCGRPSRHISFSDRDNMNKVGRQVEYSIRVIQTYNQGGTVYKDQLSNVASIAYRIPFYSKVRGIVKTPSGVGVPSVVVSYCRINPSTGLNDNNMFYCPVATFVTDSRGQYSGVVTQGGIDFKTTVEHFNVSARYVEVMADKSTFSHDIIPHYQTVELQHLTDGSRTSFQDNSTITIFGSVIFDTLHTTTESGALSICNIANVPVNLIDGAGRTFSTLSGPDGSFNFSLTRSDSALLVIPPYQGHTWKTSIITNFNRDISAQGTRRRRLLADGDSIPIEHDSIDYHEDPILLPVGDEMKLRRILQASSNAPTRAPTCSSAQSPSTPTRLPTVRPPIPTTSSPSTWYPTSQPSRQPSSKPSRKPSGQPSSHPTNQPTRQPSSHPSAQPTKLPSSQPSTQPTATPSTQPSRQPTVTPSSHPSAQPTKLPTSQPSAQPTVLPTSQPSTQPTVTPTTQPSAQPTKLPSSQPSTQPTVIPSSNPTDLPSSQPTSLPTSQPSRQPSAQPSEQPSTQPSGQPSSRPSGQPSVQPSRQPSGRPSGRPSSQPTERPSSQPTEQPSSQPSSQPSGQPSSQPSGQPSGQPSTHPSGQPSVQPSRQPSSKPSKAPSDQPTTQPTMRPTMQPFSHPSVQPTGTPSSRPSRSPSLQPSSQPSRRPTTQPSSTPSRRPSSQPRGGPSSQPDSQPSSSPSTRPSSKPTSHPLTRPTAIPTVTPTKEAKLAAASANSGVNAAVALTLGPFDNKSPTYAPTGKPFFGIHAHPSASPQSQDQPSVDALNVDSTHMEHHKRHKAADGSGPKLTSVTTSSGDTVSFNNINFAEGAAVFQYDPLDAPFIQLPNDTINGVDAISLEFFIHFDPNNNGTSSTLFSFGVPNQFITMESCFADQSVHIVVTFNFLAGTAKFYKNGIPSKECMPSVVLHNVWYSNGTFPTDPEVQIGGRGYIGRSILYSDTTALGHEMFAELNQFKVWYGELQMADVYSNFIQGDNNPDYILLPSFVTVNDIQVQFISTSKQSLFVGFYGGTSRNVMFGPETTIEFKPVDPTCGYSPSFALDPSSSAKRVSLAAMNYTVTVNTNAPAPVFADDACDYQNPGTVCKCDNSIKPADYLTLSNTQTQTIIINQVNRSVIQEYLFYYRTGICMEVTGMETFSTVEASGPFDAQGNLPDYACLPKGTTFMNKGDTIPVVIRAFERYPEDIRSSGWYKRVNQQLVARTIANGGSYMIDVMVENVTVVIRDLITGGAGGSQRLTYNDTIIHNRPGLGRPQAVPYNITASAPNPAYPFDWPFQVTVERTGIEGFSVATNTWYTVVLGSIPHAVPDVYPVSSDPTLIFLVLRDPPGGGSSTTISQDTTVSFSLSVTGMKTNDVATGLDASGYIGLSVNSDICEGLGVTVCSKIFEGTGSVGLGHVSTHSTSTARASTTSYQYSFTFHNDISTSSDPLIAGHASDLIIGGGVDLIISSAIDVQLDTVHSTKSLDCFDSVNTHVWHPGKVTTFFMPVYQIEQMIPKLQNLQAGYAGNTSSPYYKSVTNHINNWKTVLDNYRGHNTDLTAMFSAEAMQYHAMARMFGEFLNGGMTEAELNNAVTSTLLNSDITISQNQYQSAFGQFSTYCEQLLLSQNNYLRNICAGFDANSWSSLYDVILGACDMMDSTVAQSPTDVRRRLNGESANSSHIQQRVRRILQGHQNPFKNSALIKSMCSSGSPIQGNFPTGPTGGGIANYGGRPQQMFDFMKNKEELVTFTAGVPVTMSYTSTVTSDISFNSHLTAAKEDDDDVHIAIDGRAAIVIGGTEIFISSSSAKSLDVDKNSDQSREYVRTVTIVLDDADQGDYFAVRITEDPVYGTPVFTTMGGQSKCPGETGTTRREGGTRIVEIRPRCGPNRDLPCDGATLGAADTAAFGIVIESLSEAYDTPWYTVQYPPLQSTYDTYFEHAYTNDKTKPGHCGTPGQMSGLTISSQSDLGPLPYKRLVETIFLVSRQQQNFLCDTYQNIPISIVATCEKDGSQGMSVYQYPAKEDTKTGVVTIDYDNPQTAATSSTAYFSVAWPGPDPAKRNLVQQLGNSSSQLPDEYSRQIYGLYQQNHDHRLKLDHSHKEDNHLFILFAAGCGVIFLVMISLILFLMNQVHRLTKQIEAWNPSSNLGYQQFQVAYSPRDLPVRSLSSIDSDSTSCHVQVPEPIYASSARYKV